MSGTTKNKLVHVLVYDNNGDQDAYVFEHESDASACARYILKSHGVQARGPAGVAHLIELFKKRHGAGLAKAARLNYHYGEPISKGKYKAKE